MRWLSCCLVLAGCSGSAHELPIGPVTIGGTVVGLTGTGLVLQNGADSLPIAADGAFVFPMLVAPGETYAVTVASQPTSPAQLCSPYHATGITSDTDVTDVQILCGTLFYRVHVTVDGLAGTGLVLRDNGGDDLAVDTDGSYVFAIRLQTGAAFAVTVATPPHAPTQICDLENASGAITTSDVMVHARCRSLAVPRLAAGETHACAIRSDGSLWCWGHGAAGALGDGSVLDSPSPVQVGSSTDWSMVAAADDSTCGIRSDGTLWCWGKAIVNAPLEVGAETTWARVAVASGYACATRVDGTLWCWGQLPPSATVAAMPAQVGTDTTWAAVATSDDHVCGTRNDGTAWCFGNDGTGQLGNGSLVNRPEPVQVISDLEWFVASTGPLASCGIATDRSLWCWGAPAHASPHETYPTKVDDSAWAAVAVGDSVVCAIKVDDTLWCWGRNDTGALGDPSLASTTAPVQVGTESTWVELSTALTETCARRSDDTVACWGANALGDLGYGRAGQRLVPSPIASTATWTVIAASTQHTCAVATDGGLWCWGVDDWGQLGIAGADPGAVEVPAHVGSNAWTAVATGNRDSCAIRDDGTLWCWGANVYGTLGDGTNTSENIPIQVGAATGWTSVAAEEFHTCATRGDGTLWCWGYNHDGELGDGTNDESSTPVQVGADRAWRGVVVGNAFTCAIAGDGMLWCWGNALAYPAMVPQQVGVATWASIAAGREHLCGVQPDGSLWCWGDNGAGQLGIDPAIVREIAPTQVGTATTWRSVAAGGDRTCATQLDDSLWCWGTGSAGIGDGTFAPHATPELIGTAKSITVGPDHACSIDATGFTSCWGPGTGELGNGDAWRATPTDVVF